LELQLSRPCIADTSLLLNFVYIGYADLLRTLLGDPVYLSPTVLDERDIDRVKDRPRSEFRVPPYQRGVVSDARRRAISEHVQRFASGLGTYWRPATPTEQELSLGARFRDRSIRDEVRSKNPDVKRTRIELDAGEAEAAAIAVTRKWTFLTEDQASVDLVRALHSDISVVRSCSLLVHAIEVGRIECSEAEVLFNLRMVEDTGFYNIRMSQDGTRERLRLRCDPPGCELVSA